MAIGNLNKKNAASKSTGVKVKTVGDFLAKAEDNKPVDFVVDLSSLTLNELVAQYIDVDRQSHILKGQILLEARRRFVSNQEFGEWRSLNFSGLPQQTANNLMSLARYFNEKSRPLAHIPVSAGYLISAPINEPIAEIVYKKTLELEKPTLKDVRELIEQLKNVENVKENSKKKASVDKIMLMVNRLAENEVKELFARIKNEYTHIDLS
jgi:hypothetical protein